MTNAAFSYPRIVPINDSALLVEFENRIDETVNQQVLDLAQQIDSLCISGVIEVTASYRSLLIYYNCVALSLIELTKRIQTLLNQVESRTQVKTNCWRVPVFYRGDGAVDLDALAKIHHLTTDEVIRHHKESDFRVYLVGFAPGWCYLGGLNPILHTPRLDTPRLKVPAGCISIGGQQGMIGGLAMPSGWRLLGQTPVKTYAPMRQPPFFINAGDRINFYEIGKREYLSLQQAAEQGELVAEEVAYEQ